MRLHGSTPNSSARSASGASVRNWKLCYICWQLSSFACRHRRIWCRFGCWIVTAVGRDSTHQGRGSLPDRSRRECLLKKTVIHLWSVLAFWFLWRALTPAVGCSSGSGQYAWYENKWWLIWSFCGCHNTRWVFIASFSVVLGQIYALSLKLALPPTISKHGCWGREASCYD